MADGLLDALVLVRCGVCLKRFGEASRLGEMVLWPSDDPNIIPGWAWVPTVRHHLPDGRRVRQVRSWSDDEAPRSGGQQVKCHRCGATHRFKIQRLAARAEAVRNADDPVVLL